ncbi:RlpA-like double-psi beta-barrel-protein domain-containing protein-containing protein, partial [Rhodotorula toruloides]
SGQATFFYQGGNPGSCGTVHSDSDYIVAVNAAQMNSGWCGKTVSIRNTATGASITATVADTCPGCGYGSLDLSTGAFNALGSESQGVLPISWGF